MTLRLSTPFAVRADPMPCGHPLAAAMAALDGGTDCRWCSEVARLTAELAAEREKRAESEAREQRLREALAVAHDAMMTWFSSEYADHPKARLVGAALAESADDSALRAHVAAAVERVVEAARKEAKSCTGLCSAIVGGVLDAVEAAAKKGTK